MLGCNESKEGGREGGRERERGREGGREREREIETHMYNNLWPPHFRELVEGEENKLTTFSTWTIMLGCNESNIIFQQHLCKLGRLWRSNGRNSQVLVQAMKKRPTEAQILCHS